MVYTVTLNPALDYVMRLDTPLQVGQTNRAKGEPLQCGGKGINVSFVLKELGVESVALGFVAGETGAWLTAMLDAKGLAQQMLPLPKGQTRINVKLKGTQETEINGNGPQISEKDFAQLQQKLQKLQAGDVLVLAGSIPAGMAVDIYSQMMQPLAGRGVRFVVDTTGKALLDTLQYHPFLIKPNRSELEALCGRNLPQQKDVEQVAAQLQAKGARNVLVSLGAEGAFLLDETGGTYWIAAPKGVLINSVGAGDSMVAGFLAAIMQGKSYAEALQWGSAAGSATAFSQDLATGRQIQEILQQIAKIA